jgi:hypothetical protein
VCLFYELSHIGADDASGIFAVVPFLAIFDTEILLLLTPTIGQVAKPLAHP